jgi:hypothetical protein
MLSLLYILSIQIRTVIISKILETPQRIAYYITLSELSLTVLYKNWKWSCTDSLLYVAVDKMVKDWLSQTWSKLDQLSPSHEQRH